MDGLAHALDLALAALLAVGNLLALPIWWWFFGAPIARQWKRYHARGQKVVD